LIVVTVSRSLEEGRAVTSIRVAGNKTDPGAGLVSGIVRVGTVDGVEVSTVSSLGDGCDNLPVGNNKQVSERFNNLLDGSLPLFSFLGVGVPHTGLGEVEKVSGGGLNGKEDSDGHEVEHVVNSGTSESTLELVSISQVSKSDDSVGDGSTNVRSHDHVNSLLDTDRAGSDEGDNDGSSGRRGLEENSGKYPNHESGDGICFIPEKGTSCGTEGEIIREIFRSPKTTHPLRKSIEAEHTSASSHHLGSGTENFKSEQKEVEEEDNQTDSEEDHAPFLRTVAAAGAAHLFPRSISNILSVFDFEINISNVHGSGGTITAASKGGSFAILLVSLKLVRKNK
jgi:hypothetical protein